MIPGTIKLTKWQPEEQHTFSAVRHVVLRPQLIAGIDELAPSRKGNLGPRVRVDYPTGSILVTESIEEIEKLTAESFARLQVMIQQYQAAQQASPSNAQDHSSTA